MADDAIGSARLQIAGTRLVASPASQTVPFDTATIVETSLEGYEPDLGQLPPQTRMLGDLVGPEVHGVLTLETSPGEPFHIPRFRIEGTYHLENIRLMIGNELMAFAEPRDVTINVAQILLTSVSSRALTLDEIRSHGLVIDENRFEAINLTFAYGVAGRTFDFNMPLVYNTFGPEVELMSDLDGVALPRHFADRRTVTTRFKPPRAVPFTVQLQSPVAAEIPTGGCDPDALCRPDLHVVRPLVGVLLFPTEISLLHQFFSVALMVENGAPEADPAILRNLFATLSLPPGLHLGETEPPSLIGQPVPVKDPGADGVLGTADDLNFLVAGAAGSAEILLEGVKHGTHIVEFNIAGVLDGLPIGPRAVTGTARGAVVVRDPKLAVHIAHPQTVRADTEYSIFMTASNVGNAPINLIRLELPAHALSGVTLVGPHQREIETLAPGQSETVEFRVESQRTGRVVSSSVRTGSSVEPSFEWSVRVGASGALSPDALVLPTSTDSLPAEVVRQALALVGFGYSLAQSPPSLSSGLPRVGEDVVNERVYRLGQVGRHLDYGEPRFDALAILATEWLGARDGDWAWDALRRQSDNAGKLAAAIADEIDRDASSPRDAFERFAETTHFLGPQAVLGTGTGDMRVTVSSRINGKSISGAGDSDTRQRALPFAELFDLATGDLVAISQPDDTGYTARIQTATGGTGELHLLVPDDASGSLRVIRFIGIALSAGGVAEVDFASRDTTFALRVDSDGDGSFEGSETGIVAWLTPRPFAVLAAIQNTRADPSGHIVDVLFSEEVDLGSLVPRDPGRFHIADNASNGGLVPSEVDMVTAALDGADPLENPFEGLNNPRIVQVIFDNPLSPFRPSSLTISDLENAAGITLGSQSVEIETRAVQAGIELEGTIFGADGQLAAGIEVVLFEKDFSGDELILCSEHPTAKTRTDAAGRYHFGYVRQTDCGGVFRVYAQDALSSRYGSARGRVRNIGTTQTLDVVMPGRGSIIGQVRYEDGSVPETLEVVLHNRARKAGRIAHIGADGRYDAAEIIVGTVTLAASDGQGHYAYGTVELESADAVVEHDLIIIRGAAAPPGRVRGTVRETAGAPVWNASVALYIDGQFVGTRRTDHAGRFDFGAVPSGIAEIEVFTTSASVTSLSAAQVYFEVEPDRTSDVEILVRDDRGSIQGHVYRRDALGQPMPIADAVIWAAGTPFDTVTDAAGFYRLDDVFAGNWSIHAVLAATNEHTSEMVTITSAGGVVDRDLYFDAPDTPGGLIGTVLDFDGVPVSGALVHLAGDYLSTRWFHEVHTDSAGRFVIDDLAPGVYGVHAMGGGGGGVAFAEIRFPGDTAQVTVRYMKGTIRGRTVAPVGTNGALQGVVSQIAYRTVEVFNEWSLVVLPPRYTYIETEADGSFEIEGLIGPYELQVYNAFHGTASARGQLDFHDQIVEHEFLFEPTGDIRGMVLDHDGETSVPGARVELSGGSISAFEVMTDEAGRFHFPLLPVGGYQLRALHSEGVVFRQTEVRVRVNDAGEQVDGVALRLPIQGTVSGWVETADGDPVPAAVVTLQEGTYPWRKTVLNADQDGNFAFDNVLGGSVVTLYAQAPQLGGLSGRTTAEVTFEAEDVLTAIRLEPTGEIEGIVTTPVDGSRVARASVELVHNSALEDAASTNDDGGFRFRDLPLGWYQARAFDPVTGRRGRIDWIELSENDQIIRADVDLESRGTVFGHFVDSDTDSALPGHLVTLRTPHWYRVYATTGIDGDYRFGGIPEGDFSVFARDNNGRRSAYEERTIGYEDEEIEVTLRLAPFSQVRGRVHNPPGQVEGLAENVNLRVVQSGQVVAAGFDNPFAFDGIAPRHGFRVLATENGGLRQARGSGRILEAGGDVDLDLTLQALGNVAVTVRDSLGTPVPGALVAVSNRHDFGLESFSASTGDDHAVSFADVREGRVVARATHPANQLRGSATGELTTDGETLALDITLEDTGFVRGQVLLSDGVTPAAVAAVALRIGPSRWLLGEADDTGHFAFESVPMGDHQLIVQEHDGVGTIERFGELTTNAQIVDWGVLVLDDVDPQVLTIDPPLGARDQPLDTTVTITFNEPMDAARQGNAVRLRTIAGYNVPVSFSWSAHPTQLTVAPTAPLASGTGYDLFIEQDLYDLAGRDLGWRVRSTFYTADVIPPTVIDSLPRPGASQVPVDTNVVVTFSEPVSLGSLAGASLQLTDLTAGQQLSTTFQLRPGEREVIVTPVAALENDRDIQLTVQNVADLAGNVMSAPVTITFWTPDHTQPQLSWTSPAEGASFVAGETVAIAATASDNRGVASVLFSLGGWQSSITEAPYAWSVPAPIVDTPRDLEIMALVTDIFGNQESFTRTISVTPRENAEAPAILSACPADGDFVAPGLPIPIPFQVSDDESIESYWLEVDGQRVDGATPVDQSAADGSFSWTPDATAFAGQYLAMRLVARDFAGNLTEHTLTLQVPLDAVLGDGERLDAAFSGQSVAIAAGDVTWSENLALSDLAVLHGGAVYSDRPFASLVAVGAVRVQCGGVLSADDQGYDGGHGSHLDGFAPDGIGGSSIDAGGSHGGIGQLLGAGPQGEAFDSVYLPTLGGGGGPSNTSDPESSSHGGGAIWIDAAEIFVDGQVSAIGEKTHAKASGAGGSIVLITQRLTGAGTLDAGGGVQGTNIVGGGLRHHGAGGGGRIAIWADVVEGFDPASQANVAGGNRLGGPGTLLVRTASSTFGDLLIDNGADSSDYPMTPLPTLGNGSVLSVEPAAEDLWIAAAQPFRERWLGTSITLLDAGGTSLGTFRVREIDSEGRALVEGAASLAGVAAYRGLYRFDQVRLAPGVRLEADDPIEAGALELEGNVELEGSVVADSLLVKAGAHVRPVAGGALRFQVTGTMVVETGAVIEVDGLGFPGGTSDHPTGFAPEGLQGSEVDAGGSHGGMGAVDNGAGPAGEIFDSVYVPSLGGGGGSYNAGDPRPSHGGGGVIIIEAGELVLDGSLRSKGSRGFAHPGAAGGTVRIVTATLSGSGLIDASGGGQGGNGVGGLITGCGGGGRIALDTDDLSGFDVENGTRTWSGCQDASPGTIYWRDAGSTFGNLWVDSGDSFPDVPVTELPRLGHGRVTQTSAAASDLWLTAAAPLRQRWVSAWMRLLDADGIPLGTYEIVELDADGRVRLRAAGSATAATSFVGEYRFDQIQLGNTATLTADDPVHGGTVIFEGDVRVPSVLSADDMVLRSGAVVRPAVGGAMDLTVSGTLTIEAGARLDLTDLGFPAGTLDDQAGGTAPGLLGPERDRGGSHGGIGGHRNLPDARPGDVFDSVYLPNLPGGGGSQPGRAGGGVLRIDAAHLVLDGEITVDGGSGIQNSRGESGGAGGSIVIRASSLSGAGVIRAAGGDGSGNGFNGYYGSGGGGRVALYVANLSAFDVDGQVIVRGGDDLPAAPGTLFVHAAGDTFGRLIIDSGAGITEPVPATELPRLGGGTVVAFEADGNDAWLSTDASFQQRFVGAFVTLRNASGRDLGTFRVSALGSDGRLLLEGAGSHGSGNPSQALAEAAAFSGLYRFDQITQRRLANLRSDDPIHGDWTLEGQHQIASDFAAENLTLRSAATLTPIEGSDLRLRIADTLTIESGARIDVSGRGYQGGVNVGLADAPENVAGATTYAGGSHGGLGGRYTSRPESKPGETYGSVAQPDYAGAGGGGSSSTFWTQGKPGGGTLDITAGEMILDGALRANGVTGTASGGGAGGAVMVTTARLAGSGVIDVRGGGDCFLPGGGGRIALHADVLDGFDPLAQASSLGGGDDCARPGGPGTVYVLTTTSTFGDLIVAHDGVGTAAATPLPSIGFGIVGTTEIDTDEPTALWVVPQDSDTTFGVGTVGMWVRVDGVDYRVIGERIDRRGLLLADAAGAFTTGDFYRGLYAFDRVTVAGGATLEIADFTAVGDWQIDGASSVVLVDQEPPVISELTPLAGSHFTAGSLIDVTAQAHDNEAVTEVRFALGDRTHTDTEAPFTWQVPAPALTASTSFVLRAEARDAAANVVIVEHAVTVDPIAAGDPPNAALLCPGPGALLAPGTSLVIAALATDDHQVARVEFRLGGVLQKTDFAPPWTATITAPATAVDGDVLPLDVVAYDFGEQTGSASLDIPIVTGVVLSEDTLIAAGDTSIDGQSLIVAGGTVTIEGHHTLRDLVVLDGAVLTHPLTQQMDAEGRLELSLTRDLFVACGGAVDVSGRGYPSGDPRAVGFGNGTGEGAGTGVAGSHGGRGGRFDGSGTIYGSLFDPRHPGGGGGGTVTTLGGDASAGGGVIRLATAGDMRIDGQVLAPGSDDGSVHGAGGAIRLDAQHLGGFGAIDASGGGSQASHAGGGGGRIALYAATFGDDLATRVRVTGGAGSTPEASGAAGTLYVALDGQAFGELVVDNREIVSTQITELPSIGTGIVGSVGASRFTDPVADFMSSVVGHEVAFADDLATPWRVTVHAHHGQDLDLDVSGQPLTAQVGDRYQGMLRFDHVRIGGAARVFSRDPVTASQAVEIEDGAEWRADYQPSVTLASPADGATFTAGAPMTITATVDNLLGVALVTLRLSDGAGFAQQIVLTGEPYAWSVAAPAVTETTTLLVEALALDLSGRVLGTQTTVQVEPLSDPLAPRVTLDLCPANLDLVVPGAGHDIGFTATDNAAIERYALLVDGTEVALVSGLDLPLIIASVTWTVPADAPPGTVFELTLEARDFGGGTGAASLQLRVPDAPVLSGDQELDATYDNQALLLGPGVFTATEPLALSSLTMLQGATLRAPGLMPVDLTVASNLDLQCGAAIDLSHLGYPGGNNPIEGGAPDGVTPAGLYAGGSHGGQGTSGAGSGNLGSFFDSVYLPTHAGGGGARGGSGQTGGAGGGVASITAGTVRLDGEILARGEALNTTWAGTGAGGTVAIVADTLRGHGRIDVSGGDCIRTTSGRYCGLGGGGRVVLYADDISAFDARGQVIAGGGVQVDFDGSKTLGGAAGTVLIHDADAEHGELALLGAPAGLGVPATRLPALGTGLVTATQVEGEDLWINADTAFALPWLGVLIALEDETSSALGDFRVVERDTDGRLLLAGAATVADLAARYRGHYRFDRVSIRGSAGLDADDPLDPGDVDVLGTGTVSPMLVADSLVVHAGASIAPAYGTHLALEIAGTLTIEADAAIDLDHRGHAGGWSPVPGEAPFGIQPAGKHAGGSHGGLGTDAGSTNNVGEVYDSVYAPTEAGAGGGRGRSGERGGAGGGVLVIDASQIVLDGVIRANGQSISGTYAGAGAGGTVIIDTATLTGSGTIEAKGGDDIRTNSRFAGLGGGGRVLIEADPFDGFDPASQIIAHGGTRFSTAGDVEKQAAPGTVLIRLPTSVYGDLIVDQGPVHPVPVAWTPLPAIGSGTIGSRTVSADNPSDLWIEPSELAATFAPGVIGAWLRVGETDYRILDQSTDRRQVLLEGAATTLVGGGAYEGIYKFDRVILRGATSLEFSDHDEVGTYDIDPTAQVIRPGG